MMFLVEYDMELKLDSMSGRRLPEAVRVLVVDDHRLLRRDCGTFLAIASSQSSAKRKTVSRRELAQQRGFRLFRRSDQIPT